MIDDLCTWNYATIDNEIRQEKQNTFCGCCGIITVFYFLLDLLSELEDPMV
jgi:hypothetical protein